MNREASFIFLLFLAVAISACSSSVEPLEDEPFIVGEITRTEEGDEGIEQILVEEDTTINEPSESGGKKIWFGLTNQSEIFRQQEDESLSKASRGALEVGQRVKGWATGAITDSHPHQGTARRVVIVK